MQCFDRFLAALNVSLAEERAETEDMGVTERQGGDEGRGVSDGKCDFEGVI